MAWYRNHYHCGDCATDWEDEWSCCCDDECPVCGSGDWSPTESEDLTFLIEEVDEAFLVYESPISAADKPNYTAVGIALGRGAAQAYVKWRMATYWDALPHY